MHEQRATVIKLQKCEIGCVTQFKNGFTYISHF
jgi:hypothetical protein